MSRQEQGPIEACYHGFEPEFKEPEAAFKKLFNRVLKRVWEGKSKPEQIDQELWEHTNQQLESALWQGIGDFTDFSDPDHEYIDQLRHNVHVFSAFKNHENMVEVARELTDDEGNARTLNEFRKAAAPVMGKYNQTFLEAEFNTAQVSGRSARRWKEFERRKEVRPYLVFKAVQDQRVRDDHNAIHNTKLPVDDSFWNTHTPPLDWNCRCSLRSSRKATNVTEKSKANERKARNPIKPEFQNNPGKSGQVFGTAHPYFRGQNLGADKVFGQELRPVFGKEQAAHYDEFSRWVGELDQGTSKGQMRLSNIMDKEVFDELKSLHGERAQNVASRFIYAHDNALKHAMRQSKKERGAGVPLETIQNLPKWMAETDQVFVDTQDAAVIYATKHPTDPEKLVKAVVKPRTRIRTNRNTIKENVINTLGVVQKENVTQPRFKKIK